MKLKKAEQFEQETGNAGLYNVTIVHQ